MQLTPYGISDWCDRELVAPRGYLTFRLYAAGWLVRFVPFDPTCRVEKIEGVDARSACDFANDKLAQGPDTPSPAPSSDTSEVECLSRHRTELD